MKTRDPCSRTPTKKNAASNPGKSCPIPNHIHETPDSDKCQHQMREKSGLGDTDRYRGKPLTKFPTPDMSCKPRHKSMRLMENENNSAWGHTAAWNVGNTASLFDAKQSTTTSLRHSPHPDGCQTYHPLLAIWEWHGSIPDCVKAESLPRPT